MTDKPFPVDPAFLLMCAAPTAEQIREWKKERGPHTQAVIVVRVNPPGFDRFKSGQTVPAGTVVVKEKYPQYTSGVPPTAVALMIKKPSQKAVFNLNC